MIDVDLVKYNLSEDSSEPKAAFLKGKFIIKFKNKQLLKAYFIA